MKDMADAQTSPSVSVVIPYYNSSSFVSAALASVRAQTLAPLEIIVVDDASRREDAEVLDREARDCIVLHLPKNRGPSVARNVGIARAGGEWVAFLDSDDTWHPHKLERQMQVVNSNADCRAVHCGMTTVLPDGRSSVSLKQEVVLDDFLEFPCPIFPSAVIMERQALFECGLFDPTMGVCHDLDLFLRFCLMGHKFYSVPEPLMVRQILAHGVSRNIADFWSDADRVYRDYLTFFSDQQKARETLREVHTDMAVRAVYARDFGLLRRMLLRARRRDVPISLVLARLARRLVINRMQR